MADIFSKEKRSDLMSRIRYKDTKPEISVRRALHRLGYRFRVHCNNLPGKPDIVLPQYQTVIQIRGCFWHGHNCRDGHIPKSRMDYWEPKLHGNKLRDSQNDRKLKEMGWKVIIVWECRCKSEKFIRKEIRKICRLIQKK